MEFKKYYLSEFQLHDGEVFITFNIVAIDTSKLNIPMIMDSYGKFNELWEFSAYLVAKGFSILQVHRVEKFTDGNFTKASQDNDHVILRAAQYGMPDIKTKGNKTITIANRYYSINN